MKKYGNDFRYYDAEVKYFEAPKDTLTLEPSHGVVIMDDGTAIYFKKEYSSEIHYYVHGWEVKDYVTLELEDLILSNYSN